MLSTKIDDEIPNSMPPSPPNNDEEDPFHHFMKLRQDVAKKQRECFANSTIDYRQGKSNEGSP